MRYSVTGTTKLDASHKPRIERDIAALPDVDEFTTGLAEGVDTCAMVLARFWHPDAHHRVVIPAGSYNEVALDLAISWGGVARREAIAAQRHMDDDSHGAERRTLARRRRARPRDVLMIR